MEDKPIPLWQKLTALGLFVLTVVLLVVFHGRLGGDFWPIDRSFVGPNLLASIIQAGVLFILAVLFYPPLRKRILRSCHRFADEKLAPIHQHLWEAKEHRRWEAIHTAEMYEKTMGRPAREHPHHSADIARSRSANDH